MCCSFAVLYNNSGAMSCVGSDSLNSCSLYGSNLHEIKSVSSVDIQFVNRQLLIESAGTFLLVRPLSGYSMGDESSDEVKLCPMRKKLTFEFYFIFSSDMLRRQYIFFPKSVVFLPPNNQAFQNISTKKKIWLLNFLFYFFPPTRHKNLCWDPSPIEYTENGLMDCMYFDAKG